MANGYTRYPEDLKPRVTTLENRHVRSTRFIAISQSAGTITPPSQSEIILDDFGGTVDAVVSTIVGGRPTLNPAYTSAGIMVTASFDASGNYSLSGDPSAYPVALIYRVRSTLKAFDDTDADIVGPSTLEALPSIYDFLHLSDTPDSYALNANKVVSVKSDSSGLEFVTVNGASIVHVSDERGSDSASADGSLIRPYKSLSYAVSHATYAAYPYDAANSLTTGVEYRIDYVGTTDFTLLGAASNTVGLWFTKNAVAGSGNGLASPKYLNDQLVFMVEPGFYNESVTIPVEYRRKVAVIGSGVIINGSLTIKTNITGTSNNKPSFSLIGWSGAYHESNQNQGIVVAGDLIFTGPAPNNSNMVASIWNTGLRGNVLVLDGQPTITIANTEMARPDGALSYVFSNRNSAYIYFLNSKIQATICGLWYIAIVENTRIYKVDYSIDYTGAAYAGRVVGATGAAYMGGFRNSRFMLTGNKFGTDTVGTNYMYFDANSMQSLINIGSYSFTNVIASYLDTGNGVGYTPNASTHWSTVPATVSAALDKCRLLSQSAAASQPVCSASTRGLVWLVQGGAGVADTLQVCAKNASDNYEWVTK